MSPTHKDLDAAFIAEQRSAVRPWLAPSASPTPLPVGEESPAPRTPGFSEEMQEALHADAAKLSALTGEEHTVTFLATPSSTTPNTQEIEKLLDAALCFPLHEHQKAARSAILDSFKALQTKLDDAIYRHNADWMEAQLTIRSLTDENERLSADAKRLDWCAANYSGGHFQYGDPDHPRSVYVIDMPDRGKVSGDFRADIDAAMGEASS